MCILCWNPLSYILLCHNIESPLLRRRNGYGKKGEKRGGGVCGVFGEIFSLSFTKIWEWVSTGFDAENNLNTRFHWIEKIFSFDLLFHQNGTRRSVYL